MHNTLYYGDNLDILRQHIKDESVDLCYLDPPFNSNANYNVLFAERGGAKSAAQIKAFGDTWQWDEAAIKAYQNTVEAGGRVAEALQAFCQLLPNSNMLAYLAMMAPRLVELRRVLKPTGSIYLHCDPTASHYLKVLLDTVFGPDHFRSEVIWKRTSGHNSANRWGPVHDVILFYSKSNNYVWHPIYEDYDQHYVDTFYRYEDSEGRFRLSDLTGAGTRTGDSGQPWRNVNPTTAGRHWAVPNKAIADLYGAEVIASLTTQAKLDLLDKAGLIYWPKKGTIPQFKRYLDTDKGTPVQDVIGDIQPLGAHAAERLGYPTQKPLALLERIIQASSKPGDVVLDPFCGCGTAIIAAQKLGRAWLGIDVTHLAIGLIKRRLLDTFADQAKYQVVGEPVSLPDAETLAKQDPFQFQWWAVGLVGARPAEQKKGADHGIDGHLYFHDEAGPKTKQAILSVKSGHITVAAVRDLRAVIERDKAELGVLLTLQEATQPMRVEAAKAGYYESPWGTRHPRLQILTIAELLAGKRIDMPPIGQVNTTYKRAPKDKTAGLSAQLPLGEQKE